MDEEYIINIPFKLTELAKAFGNMGFEITPEQLKKRLDNPDDVLKGTMIDDISYLFLEGSLERGAEEAYCDAFPQEGE